MTCSPWVTAALASLARGEAEVVISDTRSELTRFAGNEIHQSVAERFRHVRVRLIDGGRTGVGEVRGHDGRAIERAFAAAEDSRRSPPSRPFAAARAITGGIRRAGRLR